MKFCILAMIPPGWPWELVVLPMMRKDTQIYGATMDYDAHLHPLVAVPVYKEMAPFLSVLSVRVSLD